MLTAKAAHRKDLSGKPATMTHQHFRQIAAIIRGATPENGVHGNAGRYRLACLFADGLASTNPNFARERFLSACCHLED